MQATTAENDSDSVVRRSRMEVRRTEYAYDHEFLPPLSLTQTLPKSEAFTPKYYLKRLVQTRSLLPNSLYAWLRTKFSSFKDPQDVAGLFSTLPRPEVIQDWRDDLSFARQRLDGGNPMNIKRLLHADQVPFQLPEAALDRVVKEHGIKFDDCIAEGKVYLADYSSLSSISGGNYGGIPRFMPAPRGIFFLNTNDQLEPLAIELKPGGTVRDPKTAGPIDWLAAKTWLQIADANDLEMGSHLARTHLVMEPFGIATARQLALIHPISILLRPHLSFMLANTKLGREILLAPGSLADQLCAGSLEGSRELVVASYKGWSLLGNNFPNDLAARNLDDDEMLPSFPFRDDGRLIWDAIFDFITGYLSAYYLDSTAVAEDSELQSWAAELASADGGRVKGMPSRIDSREQLRDILTTVLFTCGPQHAVVNYGQYEFLSFVPNMPLAAYCDIDPQGGPVNFETEAELMKLLPPTNETRRQLQVMNLLSAYRNDEFGHYPAGHFSDPAVLANVDNFQKRLARIETQIEERNLERVVAYNLLKPSRVPNSISI